MKKVLMIAGVLLLSLGCAQWHTHSTEREGFRRPDGTRNIGEYRFSESGAYELYNGCNTTHCTGAGFCYTNDLHCTPEAQWTLPPMDVSEEVGAEEE